MMTLWFLAATHHIVVDFWSLILMLAELREVYQKFVAGMTPSLPAAPNNYDQFVADQKEMLEGPACKRLQGYWREQLQGAPTTLELVADFERPQAFTGRAGIQPLELDSEIAAQVFQLASSLRTTPFTVVHAAIQVLLYRYTGQREFLIGSPFSGRSHQRFENTVGFFVNMLPLRADLRGEPSFEEVIRRTHSSLLGALEFEAYPFSAIVRDINPPAMPVVAHCFKSPAHLRKLSCDQNLAERDFCFLVRKRSHKSADFSRKAFTCLSRHAITTWSSSSSMLSGSCAVWFATAAICFLLNPCRHWQRTSKCNYLSCCVTQCGVC